MPTKRELHINNKPEEEEPEDIKERDNNRHM